ncbi:transposase [bacterium]|nr:transposase [bacterium]
MRLVIMHAIWQKLKLRVTAAKRSSSGTKPNLSDWLFVEAVLYRSRTGTRWRDLPAEFSDWDAEYQRFKPWRTAGVWGRLFEQLHAAEATSDVWQLFVDLMILLIHSQSAGGNKVLRNCKGPGTIPRRLYHQYSSGLCR